MSRFTISNLLPWLLFLIPVNIYIIGDWIGTGVQWILFRYQQTYLGMNLIIYTKDLQYILDGFFKAKTELSVFFWGIGIILFILTILVLYFGEEKSGVYCAGILCIFTGFAYLFSDILQYGIFLHGVSGVCIPVGIPLFFISGWYYSFQDTERKERSTDLLEEIHSFLSCVLISIITFFKKYPSICIFIILYCAYSVIFISNTNGDTVPAAYLPVSILQYHSLYFDQFGQMAMNENTNYAYAFLNGHYYSLLPIITPVIAIPIYVLSLLLSSNLSIPLTSDTIILIAKTSAGIITALSGVVVYKTTKELFSFRVALITTFVYAFATETWAISSQALWQQGTGELLLILILWCIVRNEKKASVKNIVLLGIFSGLFLFNRPPDALLLIPVFYYIISYYRSQFGYFVLAGLINGIPFVVYNIVIFGTVFGGYMYHAINQYVFNTKFVIHYIGLLVAPNVGLFIFTPVLILAIIGYCKINTVNNSHIKRTLFIFGPAILLTILGYSFFDGWYSEWCFGPRYLTGTVPVLILYCAIFFEDLTTSPKNLYKYWATAIVILLIAASIVIQMIGVYYYPFLPSKGMNDERAWDWNDSVIAGCFNAGFGKNITITMYSFTPLPPILQYRYRGGG